MNLTKIFGPSYKTTIAGLITGIAGMGAVVVKEGYGDTKIGHYIVLFSSMVALFSGTLMGIFAKATNVTGAGGAAIAVTKDGTVQS